MRKALLIKIKSHQHTEDDTRIPRHKKGTKRVTRPLSFTSFSLLMIGMTRRLTLCFVFSLMKHQTRNDECRVFVIHLNTTQRSNLIN